MRGIITRADTDGFTVRAGGKTFRCGARGNVKKSGGVAIGDFVEFSVTAQGGVIERAEKRKSLLLRPRVANADLILAVVSPIPRPDLYTVDKILVNADKAGVPVAIVANKSDEDASLFETLRKEYSDAGIEVLSFSAKTGEGKAELIRLLKGKFTVLAGNSAAGKTSVVNAVLGLNLKTGDYSEKIMRGKQTTAYSEIYFGSAGEYDDASEQEINEMAEIGAGSAGCPTEAEAAETEANTTEIMLADTPGFAAIDAGVKAEELKDYYPEYFAAAGECKFRGCTHTAEPDCAVKAKVFSGELSRGRYERYLNIYKELKERRTGYER